MHPPERDAGAACYSNQVGMSRVGFGDSRKKCGSECKGRKHTERGKQLQLPFL